MTSSYEEQVSERVAYHPVPPRRRTAPHPPPFCLWPLFNVRSQILIDDKV